MLSHSLAGLSTVLYNVIGSSDLSLSVSLSGLQIFGPVQVLIKFKDISDAIKKANATSYGLAAGVVTNDINKAMTVANSVKGGSVWLVTSRCHTHL